MLLRTGGCVLPLLCKTAEATQGAPMHPTPQVKVVGLGVMLRRRCAIAWSKHVRPCLERRALNELLGTDAAEAAWNYCAPVVDYDALRKEVVTIFADRAAEVQGMVVKLQRTQRAAEQALDQYFWWWEWGHVVRVIKFAAAWPSGGHLLAALL